MLHRGGIMKDSQQNVRHRKGKKETIEYAFEEYTRKGVRINSETDCSPNYFGFAAVVIGILALGFFSKLNQWLPSQVAIDCENSDPERFIGERAKSFLERLTNIGTRVVGSYENEVLAVDLLQREISFIMQQAESIHKIEIDVQRPTGSYYLELKPHNFKNYYANIQNIVVKFSSENSSSNSILMNCHYDTVPESPGASDNGLNCAVMLEILNKLSKSKTAFCNTVIFLFNGAEENPLQASHGFITQHNWSKNVKAVINLDSAGAGGREVLFQTTSAFPWLVETYAQTAPHPWGTVMAEDLFQSGIIPSDTDFRIFRDFGKVPGLDFAQVQNGYVYHTRFDTVDFIPPGTYQHTGDNMLALVKKFALSPDLGDLHQSECSANWKVVYFDFFGMFMVVYKEITAITLNLLTVAFSIYTVHKTFTLLSDSHRIRRDILISFLTQLLSWLFSSVMVVLVARILDMSKATMSWYSRPWLIIPLYVFPFIFTSAVLPLLSFWRKRSMQSEEMAVRCINGSQLLWTVVLLIGTCTRFRSSFIITMIVLPSAVASAITMSFRSFSVKKYIVMNIIFTAIPVAFVLHQAVKVVTILIPMTGRMGPQAEPEMVIAGVVIVFGILAISHWTPLIIVLKKPKNLLLVLCAMHVLTLLAVICTPYGFPYSGDVFSPALQRFYVLHCERTFHDSKGNVRKMDQGFFIQSLDRNNINYVSQWVTELNDARSAHPECLSELNCGTPTFTSRFIKPAPFGVWVEAFAPLIHHPTNLVVTSQTPLNVKTRRISFALTGPDHMTTLMSPRAGVKLVRWSFDDSVPNIVGRWMDRDIYMVYYSHGLMGGTLEFSMDLEVDQDKIVSDSVLDMAVIGHYMHDKPHRTEEFKEFLKKFPDWAHVTPWTATYKSWVI